MGWDLVGTKVFFFLKRLSVTLSKFYFIISHSVSILTTNFYICYMVMEMKAFIWREGIISCPSSSSIIALLWRKRREKILLSQFSKVSRPERTFLLWAWLLSFSQVHRCLTTCACFLSCCYFRTTVRKKLNHFIQQTGQLLSSSKSLGREGGSVSAQVSHTHPKGQQHVAFLQHSMARLTPTFVSVSQHLWIFSLKPSFLCFLSSFFPCPLSPGGGSEIHK